MKRKVSSKFLSYVLRHHPAEIGLSLDAAGWVDVDALISACQASGRELNRHQLEEIVRTCSKQRYGFSEDGTKIRARQGHSVDVDLKLAVVSPPAELFHGTVARVMGAIMKDGLQKMNRHHVHLSAELETATTVGGRRGRPVILVVDAQAMEAAGHVFHVSDNGVWLTDHVPPEYLRRREISA